MADNIFWPQRPLPHSPPPCKQKAGKSRGSGTVRTASRARPGAFVRGPPAPQAQPPLCVARARAPPRPGFLQLCSPRRAARDPSCRCPAPDAAGCSAPQHQTPRPCSRSPLCHGHRRRTPRPLCSHPRLPSRVAPACRRKGRLVVVRRVPRGRWGNRKRLFSVR